MGSVLPPPSSAPSPPQIASAPAPWILRATVYAFITYITAAQAEHMPGFIYSPLESSRMAGSKDKALGGLAMVQVLRYSESPVGAYDEMLLVPGHFAYKREGNMKSNLRVSRIYVSQERTCCNGRKNWNIPKHLAKFSFKDHDDGSVSMAIYPHDTTGDASEAVASSVPFFTATYKPISYVPYFPMTTSIGAYVGMDLNLVQPPLPAGKGSLGELPGTDEWCKVLPLIHSKKTSLGWWDMKQNLDGGRAAEDTPLLDNDEGPTSIDLAKAIGNSDCENWWPGFRKWRMGVKMEDATIVFEKGEHWT